MQRRVFWESRPLGLKDRGVLKLCFALCLLLGSEPLWAQVDGFEGANLGETTSMGRHEVSPGGIELTGGGESIGGREDQGYFLSGERVGDFDVRVRVVSVEFVHVWTKAGLMVRAGTESNSVQASVLATPTISGILFQARPSEGSNAIGSGNHRVNFPHTWLRLQREGNTVSGYSSYDGVHWSWVGSDELELPETVQLGLVVNSQVPETLATARFMDFGDTTDDVREAPPYDVERPGPSSRRTGLVVSELMYHPADREDGLDLEFVELMNTDAIPVEMGGFRFAGQIEFTFPEGYHIAPGTILTLAKDGAAFEAVYGAAPDFSGYEGNLSNGNGVLRLVDRLGAVLLENRYRSQAPWPVAADGTGHSLVLARPSYGEANGQAWAASAWVGGSPGAMDPVPTQSYDAIKINEFLANSEGSEVDFIELYNHSNEVIDLGGMTLSDHPTVGKYRFPAGTELAAGGFHVVDESALGFALSSRGEQLFLRNAEGSRVIDAVRFSGQAINTVTGRFPDGSATLLPLSEGTRGARNATPFQSSIVINEIMYHPISRSNDDEYLELVNVGAETVNLGNWRLDGGIRFEFPATQSLAPDEYLVIAKNANQLRQKYEALNESNTIGNYQGTLGNAGDQIRLLRPEAGNETGEPFYVLVDEVAYSDSETWGKWADGGGSSLELRDPRSDNRYGANWADSDESEKSEWTTVETTAIQELGVGTVTDLQIFLQGAGECLVDDVSFVDDAGTEFIMNGTFDENDTDWTYQGTHDTSSLVEAVGEPGNHLYVRATARGDNGANRVRCRIRRPYPQRGTEATLKARVRWLRGCREILVRPKANDIEAIGLMNVPVNLGSPGQPNGQRVTNLGPVVSKVTHFPVLPREGESVLVTAQVEDPQGVGGVELRYRVDPDEAVVSRPMTDDGTGGDRVAADGIYSALIDGQEDRTVVAFTVVATDAAADSAVGRFPLGAAERECLVVFGQEQPFGNFGTYRIWLTGETQRQWTRRLKLHNGDLNATFVYGNERVVYNTGTLYSGSPWVSPGYTGPTGALCGYVLHVPKDDRVLGATDFVLDWPIRDGSLQLEQVAFWMAEQMGLPYLRRRNINLFVNGAKRGRIYEDVQQPSRDVMEQFHPDSTEGDLYKIEDWFEFTGGGTREFNIDASLIDWRNSEGEKHLPRYRYNWRKRAVRGSAHDYESLYELVDAVNEPVPDLYTESVQSLVDIEEWLGVFALEHIVGNWDSFGYRRGKNMYAYKPADGKWTLHIWDMDFALGASTDSADTSMFNSTAPIVQRMYRHPPFTRMYYQAMQKAVDGPLRESISTAVLEANRAALNQNGIRGGSIRGGQRYIANRRSFLEREIRSVDLPFEITTNGGSPFTSDTNVVKLTGTAPLRLDFLTVNDVPYSLKWTGPSAWEIDVLLADSENTLQLRGFSRDGEFLRGSLKSIRVDFNGEREVAADHLVINEIMFSPEVEGGEYVEIFNTASSTAFSLAGYRLSGLGFEFPPESFIFPGEYLVVAADVGVYASTYGNTNPVVGTYDGRLNPDGETLRLVFQESPETEEVVVDKVTYGAQAPWPGSIAAKGSSLQLIDARRDNDRIGNWGAVGDLGLNGGWRFASVTGVATDPNLLVFLSDNPPAINAEGIEGFWTGHVQIETDRSPVAFRFEVQADGSLLPILIDGGQEVPFDSVTVNERDVLISFRTGEFVIRLQGELAEDGASMEGALVQIIPEIGRIEGEFALERSFPGGSVYLDDVELVAGSEAGVGVNLVRNGGFETELEGTWGLSENHGMSEVVDSIQHSGERSLLVEAMVGGSDAATSIVQSIEGLELGQEYTLSFRYLPNNAGLGLSVALGDFGLIKTVGIEPQPVVNTRYTPGFRNSNSGLLPEFPTVRLNEVQWVNRTGPVNGAGERVPWVELFNGGDEPLDMSRFFLSDSLEDPARWPFPEGSIIPAGGYQVVWLGGGNGAGGGELQASFGVTSDTETLTLYHGVEDDLIVVDSVRQLSGGSDASQGLFPNGKANTWQRFRSSTLGAANQHELPKIDVLITEWMARNDSTIADPADPSGREFDDWFELYNAGAEPVDLGGLFLSDNPENPTKFEIPQNTIIHPGTVLLVWADDQTEQGVETGDLHVNFKLAGGGESIGLYGPGGEALDSVTFGEQVADVSEGRVLAEGRERILTFTDPSPGMVNESTVGLSIVGIAMNADGSVLLTFTSQPGRRYQLRYRTELDAELWQDVGEIIEADGEMVEVTDLGAITDTQRFYTIHELQ